MEKARTGKTVEDLIKFIEDNPDAEIFVGKDLYEEIKSFKEVKEETVDFGGLKIRFCRFLEPDEIAAIKTPKMFRPFEEAKK